MSALEYLRSIELNIFRSFCGGQVASFTEGPGLNLIVGGNGLGKSTLVEAIEWVLCGSVERLGKESDALANIDAVSGKMRTPWVKAQFSNRLIERRPETPVNPDFNGLHNIGFDADFSQLFRFTHRSSQSAKLRFQQLGAKQRWQQIESTQSLQEIAQALQSIDQRFFTDRINARITELSQQLAKYNGDSETVVRLNFRLEMSNSLDGLSVEAFQKQVSDLMESKPLNALTPKQKKELLSPDPSAAMALLNLALTDRTHSVGVLKARKKGIDALKIQLSQQMHAIEKLSDELTNALESREKFRLLQSQGQAIKVMQDMHERMKMLEAQLEAAYPESTLRFISSVFDKDSNEAKVLTFEMQDTHANFKATLQQINEQLAQARAQRDRQRQLVVSARARQEKLVGALSLLSELITEADLQCPVCKTSFEHNGQLADQLKLSFTQLDSKAIDELKAIEIHQIALEKEQASHSEKLQQLEALFAAVQYLLVARKQFHHSADLQMLDASSRLAWLVERQVRQDAAFREFESKFVSGTREIERDVIILQEQKQSLDWELDSLNDKLRKASDVNGMGIDQLAAYEKERDELVDYINQFPKLANARLVDQQNQENTERRNRLMALAAEYCCDVEGLVPTITQQQNDIRAALTRVESFKKQREVARTELRRVLEERQTVISQPIQVALNRVQGMVLSKRKVHTEFKTGSPRGLPKLDLISKFGNAEMASEQFRSEGEQAADHLCYLIAVSLTFGSWCKWPALLLDDPLQFTDIVHTSGYADLIRRMIVERGYQIFHTTHDLDQARYLAQKCRAAGIAVRRIVFEGLDKNGPIIDQSDMYSGGASLDQAAHA